MTDPLLQRFIEEIRPPKNIKEGVGLDIACGSGRDLVYLAKQGWEMTGIDRSEESLKAATQSAEAADVDITTLALDMETGGNPFSDLPQHSFDLVTVSRYLHRPLFPYIKALIKPGGVILYQTFMVGCELTEIGKPSNPNFLLKSGELAEHFAGSTILLNEETITADERPFALFIAQL
jgi:SAM-dependent methyltransferase